MRDLPTFRKKILRSFNLLTALYASLGLLLVLAASVASRNTPNAIHRNYDSIAATHQMIEAFDALRRPAEFTEKSPEQWRAQFERALRFEEGNITEPGEAEKSRSLRATWDKFVSRPEQLTNAELENFRRLLRDLILINETGMFRLAEENTRISRAILLGSIGFLAMSIVLSILLADGLAARLAEPLKRIAEVLRSKPLMTHRLRLPDPPTLEFLILNEELDLLWQRLMEAEKHKVSELLRQKNKLEVVLGSVEDALLMIEGTGEVSHCNACMLQLIGLPLEEVIGRTWRDLSTMNANFMKLRERLTPELTDGTEISLALNGLERQYSARFRKIERPGWSHSGALFLLHDITDKKQRERLRTEIIDLLSHELKTPLQSLGTATDLMHQHRGELPDDLKPLTETMTEDVERIRAVAHEFVQVTQTVSKVLRLRLERTPLNQAILDWIRPYRITAKDRGVIIDFFHEGSEIIYADLDRVRFPWVVSNLLSNAVRFSPPGGLVQVLVSDRNGAVEIKVKDEGPGVAPGDRERIFDPFFQARTTAGESSRGLFGVGLSIAKEVVEAHEGRIEYYPNEPKGAVFRILLPFPAYEIG